MSDFASSLPVRTETNGDVAVRVVDGTIVSQALAIDAAGKVFVKLNDGTGNDITSQANGAQQALDVGINVAGVQIDPRDIRALTNADVVTVEQGTMPWDVSVTTALPTGANTIGNVGVTNLPTTVDTNYGAVGASTLRAASQIGNATGAADFNNGASGAQTLRTVANLAVGGANVSALNPVPVALAAAPSGDIVNNYNASSATAPAATSNHTYTITVGKSFQGKKIHAAASGKMKIEVQSSPDGSVFSTIFVAFNSTATPSLDIDMDQILFLQTVSVGAAIRIIRTNLDLLAQNLYSTISGVEV